MSEPAGDLAAQRQLRHNLTYNVGDVAIWNLGMAFVSVVTILPVYVSRLTTSAILIGLIPAIVETGWYLPQLFMAPVVSRMRRVKPLVMVMGLSERLPFLAIGIASLALGTAEPKVALAVFFGLLVWRSLASGLSAPGWQEMIARIIPPRRRGQFLAVGSMLGGALSLGGSVAAREVLNRLPYPTNFAVCFLAGFGVTMLSWLSLSRTVEHPLAAPPPVVRQADFWRSLPKIWREDHNFRRYIISRIVGSFVGMAPGFLAVAAVSRFALGDEQAALFSTILFGGGIAANALWGWVGDRFGHKLTLELSSVAALASFGLALVAPNIYFYYVAFAAWGVANAGFSLGTLSIVLEFGAPAQRPTYIGLTGTLRAPALAVAPVLGGWIAGEFGYPAVFGATMIPVILSLILLRFTVIEPRHGQPL